MSRPVLLIEIGAAALPEVTPVTPVRAPWVPHVHIAAPVPPPGNVTTNPTADAIVISWDPVEGADEYIIDVAPTADGPWTEVARVRGTRYTYSTTSTAPLYFRVRAVIHGRPGDAVVTPPSIAELVARQEALDQAVLEWQLAALQEAQDRSDEIAAARDALQVQIDALEGAAPHDPDQEYLAGTVVIDSGKMYQAIQAVPVEIPITDTDYWAYIGDYSSMADAVAALTIRVEQHTQSLSDIDDEITLVNSTLTAHRTRLEDAETGISANTDSIQLHETRIEQAEDELLLQSLQLQSVTADLGDKIGSTAFNALQSTVSQQGDQISTTASDLSTVATQVGDQSAQVTQLAEVVATTAARYPVIRNAGFEEFVSTTVAPGWSELRGIPSNSLPPGYYIVTTSPHTGSRCLRIGESAAQGPGGVPGINVHDIIYTESPIPVNSGDRVRLSFWTRITQGPPAGSRLHPYLHFLAADGERLDYTVGGALNIPIANHGWTKRVTPVFTVPDGAVGVVIDFRTAGNVPIPNCYIYIDDVRPELISETEDVFLARHTNMLDVNGNISGTVSENDGVRSAYSILSTVFRVFTAGAASGMEWQANYIRIYGSGYQLVMGTGFGSSSNLVQWFGPNIGAAACTLANCIEAKTTNGQTVIRGSNAQGSVEITNTQVNVRDSNNVLRVQMGLW